MIAAYLAGVAVGLGAAFVLLAVAERWAQRAWDRATTLPAPLPRPTRLDVRA